VSADDDAVMRPGNHSAMIKSYRDLVVWQRAMVLVVDICSLTRRLPPEERFGLTAQLRSAACSVPSNIAEGYNRTHRGDYLRFLSVANGSIGEIETQLTLCEMLGLLDASSLQRPSAHAGEIGRMLRRMIEVLGRRPRRRSSTA
jgi:four helix bundle protein